MIQQRITGATATWAKCPSCGGTPYLIQTMGRSRRETMDFSIPAIRYSLECRCGRTTARCATVAGAEAEWGLADAQIPMRLPVHVTDLTRHRRRNHKGVRK